jgi:hypothetical protein
LIVSFKVGRDMAAHLSRQENKSAYIRQLIRREMETTQIERTLQEIARRRRDPQLEEYFKKLLEGRV